MEEFLERHLELSLRKDDVFALSRAAAITDNSMRQATLEERSILDCPSQIYSMNESGTPWTTSLQRLLHTK